MSMKAQILAVDADAVNDDIAMNIAGLLLGLLLLIGYPGSRGLLC